MAASEQVELVVGNIRYKKRDGSLYLMSERIAWCPEGRDHFDVAVRYADIKCQKVSPEGKAKVQLQIILLNGDSYVFHFAHTRPETAKNERESVKNLLIQMLPRFRRKIDKELEEKNKLLQVDPGLFQTYKDLVVSGVISPEEFWMTHSSKLSKTQSTSQNVGVSAAFLADVRPQADGCNGLRYNLTSDTIQSIFTTYPAVKKKYMEKVPDKMTEKDFWTMFFQSHYFHRDRINQGNSSKDIFSDCVKKDDQDILSLLNLGVKDAFNDLSYFYDDDSTTEEGYGSRSDLIETKGKQSNQHLVNRNIIKRFNHQNAMILAARSRATIGNSAENGSGDGEPPIKRAKLKEATTYSDLEETNKNETNSLNISRLDRYSHGPTLVSRIHQELDSRSVHEGMDIVASQCRAYKPRLTHALNSTDAAQALSLLSPGDSASHLKHSSDIVQRILSSNQQDELKQLYTSATELLRHFWSCFPASTSTLQEKVVRMCSSIEQFHATRVKEYKDQLRRSMIHVNPTEHLEEMFNIAYTKFNSWQAKKMARR